MDQNLVKIYEISYFLPHTENNIYVLETKQVLKIGELPLKSAQVLKLKGSNSTSAESSGTQSLAALGVENQELYMDLLTVYVGGLSTSQIAQKSGVREDVIKGFLTRAFVPTRSERRKIEIFNTAALRRLHLQTVTFDDRALMKVFKTLYFDLGYDRARSGALAIELSLSQEDLQKILQGVYQGKRLTLARAVAFLKSRKVMAFKTRSRFIAEAQLTVPILHTVFDIRRAFTQKLSAALRRHGHLEKEMENPQLKFSFLPPHKEFYTSPDKQRIRIHEMREGDWKVSALNPELPFPKEVGISSVQDSTQVLNNLNLALEGWIFNIETISDLSDIARAIELEVEEIESGRIENARLQTLAITPRSLMTQVEVDDTPVPSGLLDVVAFFFNNLENLKKLGLTPQLALHVETVEEALFWNQALARLEQSLRLEKGAIKVFILVKNYRTLFELEEILWALQSRAQAITLGEGMFNSIAATRIKTIAEKRKIHFISDLYLKRTAESELEVDYSQDAENRLNEMRKGTILDKDDLSKAISEAFETLYVHLGGDVRGNSFTIQELDQLEMQQLNIWNAVHGGEEVKVKYYLNLFSDSLIKKYKELEARLELTTGKDFPEIRKHLTLAFAILQQAMVNSKVFVPLSQLVEVVASDLTNPDQALERMVQFSEFSSQPNIRGFYAAAKLSLWNQLFKEVFSQGVRPQHNEPQVKVNIESSEPLKNPSRPIILSQIGGILAWPLLPIDIKLEVVTFVKNFVLWAAAHPMAIVSGVLLMGALVLAVKAWVKPSSSAEKLIQEITQLAKLNNVALAKSKLEKRLAKSNKRNERALFLGALHAMGGDVSKGFEKDYKGSVVSIIHENAPVQPVLQAYAEDHIGFKKVIIRKDAAEKIIQIQDAKKDKEYQEKFRMGYSAVQMARTSMEQKLEAQAIGVSELNANSTKVIVAGKDGRYSLAFLNQQLDQIELGSQRKVVLTGRNREIQRLLDGLDSERKKILETHLARGNQINGKQVKILPESSGKNGRVNIAQLYERLFEIGWAHTLEVLSENPEAEIEESIYHSMWVTIYKIVSELEVQRMRGMKELMEENRVKRLIEFQA